MLNIAYPCKNCPRKGCGAYHSQCEPYQTAVKRNAEIRAERDKDIESRNYDHDNHARIERIIRKNKH